MGIYGESMNLVTEGKIVDKIKKALNKIGNNKSNKKNKEKFEKRKEYKSNNSKEMGEYLNSIEARANLEADKMPCFGNYKFYEKYFAGNLSKIFCKITNESSEAYIIQIKNIFGYDNKNDIIADYKRKYAIREFFYTNDDFCEAYDNMDYLKDSKLEVSANVRDLETFEKDNKINSKDRYFEAVNLQVELFKLANMFLDELMYDYEQNYKNALLKLRHEEEMNKKK